MPPLGCTVPSDILLLLCTELERGVVWRWLGNAVLREREQTGGDGAVVKWQWSGGEQRANAKLCGSSLDNFGRVVCGSVTGLCEAVSPSSSPSVLCKALVLALVDRTRTAGPGGA